MAVETNTPVPWDVFGLNLSMVIAFRYLVAMKLRVPGVGRYDEFQVILNMSEGMEVLRALRGRTPNSGCKLRRRQLVGNDNNRAELLVYLPR